MNKKVEQFRDIAEKRWEYLEKGDSKNGNKCFDELEKLITEFKAENDLESLIVLLEYPNDGVKLETASKLLPIYPVKSVQVLESLTIKRGILPFTAKQTLKQWKAGKMNR